MYYYSGVGHLRIIHWHKDHMRKTSIGGQALLEGILMIGPECAAIAVRKPDNEIELQKTPFNVQNYMTKIPFLRGSINLFRQMVLGMRAIMFSASFIDFEEEKEPSKIETFLSKIFGKIGFSILIYLSVILSLFFSIGLFILLPNILVGFFNMDREIKYGLFFYNMIEGILRITIFFGYIVITSKLQEIKRVWEYHGAEHKTINCYEKGEELTVDNVKKQSTMNPRCGTSFMFLVMFISIIVFSFLGWHSIFVNILLRIVVLPLVAGISYEIIKVSGRSDLKIFKIVSAPGLLLQLFTTREPDDKQIEVAIAAFNSVLVDDRTVGED